VIIRLTGALGLSPHMTFEFAHLLAGLKLMVGALLLTALVGDLRESPLGHLRRRLAGCRAVHRRASERMRRAARPDPCGVSLQEVIGELMLCVIASRLAIYGVATSSNRICQTPGALRSATCARIDQSPAPADVIVSAADVQHMAAFVHARLVAEIDRRDLLE